jgi:O-antigen/teichoic acid export membrane protein
LTIALGKKTLNSVAWTYFSYGLSKSMVLITTVVLTHILTKADFGIIGFAVTAMSFLDAVRDLGLGLALIQRRDRIEEAADTVFWLSLGSNVVMWLLASISAPFVAAFFHESQIIAILPVISFSFVISSLGGTHDALLQREMKFSRRIIPFVGESLAKGAVSITLALLGLNVWALVAGQITGRAAFSAIAWRILPWRPRRRFSWDLAKELFRFGYKIAVDSFLSNLQANIDYVFIGRFLGETALGVYTVAFRIPELVIINLCIVIAQVLFPVYAELQEDREQLKRGVLTAIRYIALVTVPAGVGLALVSHVFTRTIFGADWTDAAPIMAALSIYGTLLAVSWNIGDVYKAIGRPDILWKTAIFEFALLGPVLYVLAQRSAFAVSLGHVSVAFVVSAVRLSIAMYLLKLSVKQTLSQFIPSVVGGAIMGAAVWSVLQVVESWPGLIALSIAVLVGGISYAAALWRLERDLILDMLGRINCCKMALAEE